ncbi:MAG: hypothetical protein R2813_05485 [Flavobacteriales bacterium]
MSIASRLALISCSSILLVHQINAQTTNSTKQNLDYFIAPALGFGMIYGGLGGTAELGYGHFSVYGSLGYAPRNSDNPVVIKNTINVQGGGRYYFDVGSDLIFPRIGFGYGWITNYYDERIGTAVYDQSVDGLSIHTGLQIYSEEGVIFNFDIAMSSNLVINNPSTHPYFFAFYIRPCIGVGYDVSRAFNRKKSRRIQNKEINPFG